MGSSGGYAALKGHPFFSSVASWSVSEMHKVKVPAFPATPKSSPVHDEEKKGDKMLRGSVFTKDEETETESKKETETENAKERESAFSKWEPFLNSENGERIEMGSTVRRSKYLGMGSEKSVLLLTSHRVLMVDPSKMRLRKNGDIQRENVKGVEV